MTFHILTGAPGAGKTVILRGLERAGLAVVEEAATDVIAWKQATGDDTPWTHPDFCDSVLALQVIRERRAPPGPVVFDRSPACTLALSLFLEREPSAELRAAAAACRRRFAPVAYFVESLPRVTQTAARQISLEDARRFGVLHREVYLSLGFDLIDLPPMPVARRVEMVLHRLRDGSASADRSGPGPPT